MIVKTQFAVSLETLVDICQLRNELGLNELISTENLVILREESNKAENEIDIDALTNAFSSIAEDAHTKLSDDPQVLMSMITTLDILKMETSNVQLAQIISQKISRLMKMEEALSRYLGR